MKYLRWLCWTVAAIERAFWTAVYVIAALTIWYAATQLCWDPQGCVF